MEIVKNVAPPAGFTRFVFRIPIHLYRLKLGCLFGSRLLLLNHTGRVSGKRRQTVLEVAERNGDSYVVASGWGPTAAWYRNIRQSPDVTIQVGTHTVAVTAVPLDKEEGAQVFARYGSRHRAAAKYVLPRVLGFAVDGSDEDFRAVGQHLPFVRFIPRAEV
jgi:deazaflavin-dependent oxidoreductase (nitroreductase family)